MTKMEMEGVMEDVDSSFSTTYPQRSWIIGALQGPQGGFLGFGDFFWIFAFFNWVVGFKTYSNLFLELLPSSWVPGKPSFFLPGSFRGLVCSKIRPRLLNKLFVYSAGRAIVSRDAPTTQICSPTAQNTQKPTPTK